MSTEPEVGACYRDPDTEAVVRVLERTYDLDGGCWYQCMVITGQYAGTLCEYSLTHWERVSDPTPAILEDAAAHDPEPARSAGTTPVSRVQAFRERVYPLAEVGGIEIDEATSPYTIIVRVTFYLCMDGSPLVVVVRSESLDEAFTRAEQMLRDAVEVKP